MQDAGPRAQILTGSKTNTEQETKRVDDEEWESFKEGLNEWMRRSESRGRRGYLLPIPSARRGEGGGRTQQGRRKHVHTTEEVEQERKPEEFYTVIQYFRLQFISDFSWMDENALDASSCSRYTY
jgi:hypothetical protein